MRIFQIFILIIVSSCAITHHVKIGDIFKNSKKYVLRPFNIKVSEVGVSTKEAAGAAKLLTRNAGSTNDYIKSIAAIIALFQMGPTTGVQVYNEHYADGIMNLLYEKCPTGRITGLNVVRETRKYPIISGEIININGKCILKRTKANLKEVL